MKHLVTIAWIVIIVGGTFIAINAFKPEAIIEQPLNISSLPEEVAPEIDIITIDNGSKTYTEHIKDGDNYLANNLNEAAIREYNKALKLTPNSTQILVKLARALLANNQGIDAKNTLVFAGSLEPESIPLKLELANTHLSLREFNDAKDIVWPLDEQNPDVKYHKGLLLILNKDPLGAKTIFEDIIDITTEIDANLRIKTQIFLDKYRTYDFFTEASPLQLQVLLAQAFTEVELFEASIPLLFDVINEQSNYRDAWIVLGYSYLNTHKSRDAVDAFQQALSLDENNATALYFLGISYFIGDDIDKAILYIEEAEEAGYQPKEELDLKLGELYLLQNKFSLSAQRYESVIASSTVDLGIYIRTIWLNIDKLDKAERGLNLARHALAVYPNNAMSYNLMGWAQYSMKDYKEAEISLKKAIEIDPTLESAHYNFGRIYEEQGQTTIAKEYYKKAYQLGHGNDISKLAATQYNKLTEEEQNKFYQVNSLNL